MKAVVCDKFGPPEVLRLTGITKPAPKDNEVLIRIHATTATKYDCWVRSFRLPTRLLALLSGMNLGLTKPKNPLLGTELAGEIEATGNNVKLFRKGDQVFAYSGMNAGDYGEYMCFPEDGVLATKPENMTYEEAASIQQGALTALFFLRKGNIRKGQKILIFGASGGVGIFAVQLAKYFGAELTGVCSTGKVELVKSLGADKVIDYAKEEFTMNGETYDIIFDTVGKSPFSGSVRSLKKDGIYLLTTYKPPRFFQIIWFNLTNSKKVLSPLLKERTEDLLFLKELIERGKLRTVIDRIYSLEQAAEAHRYVESGEKKGTVVISVVDDKIS